MAYDYNGFGHLLESDDIGSDVYEYFERDAFGNASFHHSFPRFEGPSSDPGSAFANTHPAQKGGQISVAQEEWTFSESPNEPFEWEPGWKTYTYESGSGRRIAAGSESYTWQFSGGTEGYDTADKQAEHRSYARSYYSPDGKLRVHQINRDSLDYRFYDPPQDTTIFEGTPGAPTRSTGTTPWAGGSSSGAAGSRRSAPTRAAAIAPSSDSCGTETRSCGS